MLAGGDPKPHQNVRIVDSPHHPHPHKSSPQRQTGTANYHHLRRDHQQFRGKGEGRNQKEKTNLKEGKFRLWKDGPNFDIDLRQDVYAQEGQDAILTCRVFDRGNKTVCNTAQAILILTSRLA